MDNTNPERGKPASSLTSAIRVARFEEAERSKVLGDLRGAEVARLELLREVVAPVLAEVPAEVDLFDIGIVPGEHPRLFIDMISFVEMGRDRRLYRFVQDTRHGRVLIAENENISAMIEAITRYIARRLVEREKALASLTLEDQSRRIDQPEPVMATTLATRRPRSPFVIRLLRGLRIGVDFLGVLTLACLAWLGVQYLQGHVPSW